MEPLFNARQMKSPEERKAIAAKAHATKRRNREDRDTLKREAMKQVHGLQKQIEELELKLAKLQTMEAITCVSVQLTGKALLREEQIAEAAVLWGDACGVYFLLKNRQVVYVGQSVNVYPRIASHVDKEFDSYAYIPCAKAALDKLESLYIHCLRPPLNGNQTKVAKAAPIALDVLLGI